MGAVVWAEASDDDQGESDDPEAQGEVDETFATRRLKRWLRGMFGGGGAVEAPPDPEQDR